jgi:hypothetical protein
MLFEIQAPFKLGRASITFGERGYRQLCKIRHVLGKQVTKFPSLRRLQLRSRAALGTHCSPLNPATSAKVHNTWPPSVSVRVREVDAAPRCACLPRIARSTLERPGLERAISREARRPHRVVRVDAHRLAAALQGAGQRDALPVPRASDMINTR